jgi:hypothetical protein
MKHLNIQWMLPNKMGYLSTFLFLFRSTVNPFKAEQ